VQHALVTRQCSCGVQRKVGARWSGVDEEVVYAASKALEENGDEEVHDDVVAEEHHDYRQQNKRAVVDEHALLPASRRAIIEHYLPIFNSDGLKDCQKRALP